jgi:hypothetical protein
VWLRCINVVPDTHTLMSGFLAANGTAAEQLQPGESSGVRYLLAQGRLGSCL